MRNLKATSDASTSIQKAVDTHSRDAKIDSVMRAMQESDGRDGNKKCGEHSGILDLDLNKEGGEQILRELCVVQREMSIA